MQSIYQYTYCRNNYINLPEKRHRSTIAQILIMKFIYYLDVTIASIYKVKSFGTACAPS